MLDKERLLPTFVGREAELHAFDERIGSGIRLINVLGPPGVGKSRFVIEYAKTTTHRATPPEILSVGLEDVESKDGVLSALAAALDAPIAALATDDAVVRLGETLAARGRLLLVLDAAERSAPVLAPMLASFLGLAPLVTVVVTSRVRIGVEGEVLFDVRPLSLSRDGDAPSEAARLFIERARTVRRDFSYDAGELPAIEALVASLDGLPLAIELAAARARVLGPREMLVLLDQNHLLPTARTANGQTKLEAAIASSWDALSPREKVVFARCSVFRGGFTIDAAAAVGRFEEEDAGEHYIDVLESLVDRSLLAMHSESGAETQLTMLESIRRFASRKLDESDERAEAEGRHSAYFLVSAERWAARMDTSQSSQIRSRFPRHRANVLEVHRRAVAHRPASNASVTIALRIATACDALLTRDAVVGLRLSLLEDAFEIASTVEPDAWVVARALIARAEARRFAGERAGSLADLDRALALATALDDSESIAWAHLRLATRARFDASFAVAREHLDHALSHAELIGDPRLLGMAHHAQGALVERVASVGTNESSSNDAKDARHHYHRALTYFELADCLRFQAITLGDLANVDTVCGHYEHACKHYEASLERSRQARDSAVVGHTLVNYACPLLGLGRIAEARAALETAYTLSREVGHVLTEGGALLYLAHASFYEGALEDARRYAERAAPLLAQSDIVAGAMACALVGTVAAAENDMLAAQMKFDEAERVLATTTAAGATQAIVLSRAHLDIALGRQLDDACDARAEDHVASVGRALDHASHKGSWFVALARLHVTMAFDRWMKDRGARRARASEVEDIEKAVVVSQTARWFRPPFGGRVDLERRTALRRMLRLLADDREAKPGDPVPVASLIEAGWPGERVLPRAAVARIYVGVSTLRKLGLKDLIVRHEDGYSLAQSVPFVRAPDE